LSGYRPTGLAASSQGVYKALTMRLSLTLLLLSLSFSVAAQEEPADEFRPGIAIVREAGSTYLAFKPKIHRGKALRLDISSIAEKARRTSDPQERARLTEELAGKIMKFTQSEEFQRAHEERRFESIWDWTWPGMVFGSFAVPAGLIAFLLSPPGSQFANAGGFALLFLSLAKWAFIIEEEKSEKEHRRRLPEGGNALTGLCRTAVGQLAGK